MSLTTSEMTPADIRACTCDSNNGGLGMGGDWLIAIVILFLFPMMFGGGMFGWGGGFGGGWGVNNAGMQGALTRADLCSEFNFNGLENSVRGVQQGICDSTFALNNSINSLSTNVMQGFHGVDNAVCNLGYQTQQGFNNLGMTYMQGQNALQSQIANCCCGVERAIDGVNYNSMANTTAIQNTLCNSTRDIIDSQNNGTRAILDALTAQRIEAKDQRIAEQAQTISQLQIAASQSNQNAILMAAMDANTANIIRRTGNDCPVNAYVVQPPTPVSFPTNCYGQATFSNNGGCGNSGCC